MPVADDEVSTTELPSQKVVGPPAEIVGVAGVVQLSPMANSLKLVSPVHCVVVAVLVPFVVVVQVAPSNFLTTRFAVLAPPWISPGTKVKVGL